MPCVIPLTTDEGVTARGARTVDAPEPGCAAAENAGGGERPLEDPTLLAKNNPPAATLPAGLLGVPMPSGEEFRKVVALPG